MRIRLISADNKLGYICSQTFGKMFTKAEGDEISPRSSMFRLGIGHRSFQYRRSPCYRSKRPGAIFWMWILPYVGCCIKYVK